MFFCFPCHVQNCCHIRPLPIMCGWLKKGRRRAGSGGGGGVLSLICHPFSLLAISIYTPIVGTMQATPWFLPVMQRRQPLEILNLESLHFHSPSPSPSTQMSTAPPPSPAQLPRLWTLHEVLHELHAIKICFSQCNIKTIFSVTQYVQKWIKEFELWEKNGLNFQQGSVKCRLHDCGPLFWGLENNGTIYQYTYSFEWWRQ